MHGAAAVRVGVGDNAGLDVVRELLFNGRSQSDGTQVCLHVCQVPSRCGGHRQVRAGTVLGPPPAPAEAGGDDEQKGDDSQEYRSRGHLRRKFARGRLLGRGGSMHGGDGGRGGESSRGGDGERGHRLRELGGHDLCVQGSCLGITSTVLACYLGAAVGNVGGNGRCGLCHQVEGVGRVGASVRGVTRGERGDEVVDLAGNPRKGGRGTRNVVRDVVRGDLQGGFVSPRHGTGEHLVEHDANGVQVGARVSFGGQSDLGCDVGNRSQHVARGEHRHFRGRASQAEVGDLRGAVGWHKNVLGFDVTVDDAHAVSRAQSLEDVGRVAQCPRNRERALGIQECAQVGPIDELHDEETLA